MKLITIVLLAFILSACSTTKPQSCIRTVFVEAQTRRLMSLQDDGEGCPQSRVVEIATTQKSGPL